MLPFVGPALNLDHERAARVASARRYEKKNHVGSEFRGSELGEVGLADAHGFEVRNAGIERASEELGRKRWPLSE